MNEMNYGLKEVIWNVMIEGGNVPKDELTLSDCIMMWCKTITEQLSFFQTTSKLNVSILFFPFKYSCKVMQFFFRKQPKHCSNIFQHCSIYQFGFFEACHDGVFLVKLGVIGLKWLMIVNEVTGFDKFLVCSGVVSIKCLWFLIMAYPFSFWTVYNSAPLVWFTAMAFLS